MSIFQISKQQKDEYFGRGYTSIKNAISPDLLNRLQSMAKKFEDNIMEAHEKSQEVHGACIVKDPVGDRLMRYDDIFSNDWDTTLDLLASSSMMAIFRDICGKGAVPLQVDILYKYQHPHPIVIWHQGAQHPRTHPYLNVGVFLDDSGENDGCLRYVPNTQHEKQDIQGLSEKYGWDIPNVVEFPAKAGDINIQDMMILHGSQPKRTKGVRRTIYIEIRPYEGIIEDNEQSKEWTELRKRFMGLVLRRANSSDWPDEWKKDYPSDLKSDEEEINNIMKLKEPPTPAYYASFPVKHKEYPIPSDLRNDK